MNLYKQNLDTLKDGRAAYFQTATQLRGVVEMRLQDAKLKLDPNNVAGRTAIDAAIAENRLKAQQAKQGLAQIEMQKYYEQAQKEGKPVQMPDEQDPKRDRIVRVPGPKGESIKLYARAPGMVEKLQERANAISRAKNMLKRITEFNYEYGRQVDLGLVDTKMADAAETLNRTASFAVQGLVATGSLTPRSEKLIQEIFPTAGAIKQEDAQTKTTEANKILNDEIKILIENNLSK
jgi:hypothetical protein